MYLRDSILSTILYYDIFDIPLTLTDVFVYLINPARIDARHEKVGTISMSSLQRELASLSRIGILGEKNGFYFLPGRDSLYQNRIEEQKLSYAKWKNFLKKARWLTCAPYLKAIFLSGSLAVDNPSPESDFDVLVIARSGRIYTARFFLWVISSVLGIRRKRHEKIAPDKICFNHFITDSYLAITHRSIYTAQMYINLKPVFTQGKIVENFCAANGWLNAFCFNFKTLGESRRKLKPPPLFSLLARFGERALGTFVGDWLEAGLRWYQQKRIRENPATYEKGGRIIFTEDELEFHPHSFEASVIEKYNKGLKQLGIVSGTEEKDSGLNI